MSDSQLRRVEERDDIASAVASVLEHERSQLGNQLETRGPLLAHPHQCLMLYRRLVLRGLSARRVLVDSNGLMVNSSDCASCVWDSGLQQSRQRHAALLSRDKAAPLAGGGAHEEEALLAARLFAWTSPGATDGGAPLSDREDGEAQLAPRALPARRVCGATGMPHFATELTRLMSLPVVALPGPTKQAQRPVSAARGARGAGRGAATATSRGVDQANDRTTTDRKAARSSKGRGASDREGSAGSSHGPKGAAGAPNPLLELARRRGCGRGAGATGTKSKTRAN